MSIFIFCVVKPCKILNFNINKTIQNFTMNKVILNFNINTIILNFFMNKMILNFTINKIILNFNINTIIRNFNMNKMILLIFDQTYFKNLKFKYFTKKQNFIIFRLFIEQVFFYTLFSSFSRTLCLACIINLYNIVFLNNLLSFSVFRLQLEPL